MSEAMNKRDYRGKVRLQALGQAGFALESGEVLLLIDPYLSDHVEEVEGKQGRRQFPAPRSPASLAGARWVLITHEHLDHCDPVTLTAISKLAPDASFIGPYPVINALRDLGIAAGRLLLAPENWLKLDDHLSIRSVPAAHPLLERDAENRLRYVGFMIDFEGLSIYHSGDTSLTPEIMAALEEFSGIDLGLIAVNERNFFKERKGIIGNMTVREAFGLARQLRIKTLVPTHWDMFLENSVYPEEITLLYEKQAPGFRLQILHAGDEAMIRGSDVG